MNHQQRPWQFWFVIGAVLAAFGPMLYFYFRQQWARPEYQAFPIVILAGLTILWMRSKEAIPTLRWSGLINVVSGLAFVASLGMLGLSYLVFSPWLGMAAFIVMTFAVAAKVWQYWIIPGLWGVWALQFLLLPPPLDRDQMFIEYLQLTSSRLTSSVLDALGVLHLMQGNTLTFVDKEFFVDEACSGIVSLISILSITALYSLWKRYRLGATAFLLVCGGIWAVLMNTIRLTTIAVAWDYYDIDLAEGTPHMMLGLVLFMVSVGVLMLMARFASYWFDPIHILASQSMLSPSQEAAVSVWNQFIANEVDPEEEDDEDAGELTATATFSTQAVDRPSLDLYHPTSITGLPAMAAVAILGLVFAVIYIPTESTYNQTVRASLLRALDIDGQFFGENPPMELTNYSDDRRDLFRWDKWGEHSRTFTFADKQGNQYMVSCDFMFGPHWHDLRVCYRGTGWKIADESIIYHQDLGNPEYLKGRDIRDSLIPEWTIERFFIERKDSAEQGFVAYAAFRADGDQFNRPRGDGLLSDFWAHLVQGRDRAEQADYFQIQVSTVGVGKIDDQQQQTAETLLKESLDRFREAIVKGNSTKAGGTPLVGNP